ncbi:MAG TPA: ComEC/Rec2 family competence protein [Fimbriimonas sp.]|nr:ComEC/Rec2 family competence protein [Fimbriimonas sp.]
MPEPSPPSLIPRTGEGNSEFEGRPILGVVGALIIGLTAALHPLNLLLFPAVFLVWRNLSARIAFAAALLLGVLMAPKPVAQIDDRTDFSDVVRVDSVPTPYMEALCFDAKIEGVSCWVRLPGQSRISFGDHIHVTGSMKPLGPDQRYMALQGIGAIAQVDSYKVVQPAPLLFRAANGWRWSFIDFAFANLPPRMAGVAAALCFNTDKLVDPDFNDDLKQTGTIHIVSVSGLHIVVLALALLFGLSKLPIPRGVQLAIAALVLSFYALATGLSPPTVRAVLMVGIAFAAYLLKREPDWLSSLACSALIYLLWQPRGIYDIGFQLSFLTVAAFCLYLRPERDVQESVIANGLAQVRQIAWASLVASVASAPLVIYYFGQASVVSVLANLMIAPAVEAIIVCAFIAHGLWLLMPVVGAFALDIFVKGWIGYLYAVLDFLAAPSWSVLPFPEFNGYLLLPFYAGAVLMWRPYVRRA